ncbi:hypothetical protein SAMN04490186_2010 [Pseudomonas grimontii]|uniref:Uncharacterized protein n=1 Tax=Pseudomonas grimontii TaxID=129847 RepID=A0A1H1DUY0_9PSED|nr:hypothetical protein [Pseudomonas grimontii]TWR68274.1 hypothetical protein FIV39_07220 [Pseudomonas grimontii]SDQ80203.1 hypothetical protein SAMN04490186_2010 [Pseudomonas grimontii]
MSNNTQSNEISFQIKLVDVDHPIEIIPSAELKNGVLILYGSRLILTPGPARGLHSFEVRINNNLLPGTYDLNGQPGNPVKVVYIAPNTNVVDSYHDESGSFDLHSTATPQHIEGTFSCVAKNASSQIPHKAYLSAGRVSLNKMHNLTSTGELTATIYPTDSIFKPSLFFMRFIETNDRLTFLEVKAKKDNISLHLYIPQDKLGDGSTQTLQFKEDESSEFAFAVYIHGYTFVAQSGSIKFRYSKSSETLTGDIEFNATGGNPAVPKITFTSSSFRVTGLDA